MAQLEALLTQHGPHGLVRQVKLAAEHRLHHQAALCMGAIVTIQTIEDRIAAHRAKGAEVLVNVTHAFPASLVGMFGILGGLWGLSAPGMEPTAAKIVAAARPALNWVTRYLPLFYVPALIVLPLVVGMLDPVDLGKIGVVTAAGFPFSLFAVIS